MPLTYGEDSQLAIVQLLAEVAEKYCLSDLSERLQRFRDLPGRPYTIGLLGEQPAKARMLNSLAGSPILDPYSGLGQKRSVRYGTVEALAWGGYVTERHADQTWYDIRRVTESLPEIEIIVSAAELHRLGAALVDIPPGAGGVLSQAEWRDIEQCHGLILVVQAASMLTRHEVELLYQIRYRCGPSLSGILVVGLEHVEEPERQAVIHAVRRSSEKHLGELPVVACPAGDSGARELAAMIDAAKRSAAMLGTRWLDSAKLATLLSDALEQLDALAGAAAGGPAENLDPSHEDSDYLLDARLQSLARSSALVESLQRDLSAASASLAATVIAQVRDAPDPARWLNESLASEIAEALASAASAARGRITSAMEESISWLEAAARDRGITWVRVDLPRPRELAVPTVEFAGYSDQIGEQLRFFSRLSSQVLGFVVPLLSLHFQVPIPNPDSVVGNVFDEIGRRHRMAEQPTVDVIVRRAARRAFDELTESLISLVRRFDSELIRQLKENRDRLQFLRAAADRQPGLQREALAGARAELEQALESLRSEYVH